MSRTYAHTPFRVLAAKADDLTITHHGCSSDPERSRSQPAAPCDALTASQRRGGGHCQAGSDNAWDAKYGYGHHHCHGPSDWERDTWYTPERAQWTRYAKRAAAEYNTTGQIDQYADEPATMPNPRGLWGGGWID